MPAMAETGETRRRECARLEDLEVIMATCGEAVLLAMEWDGAHGCGPDVVWWWWHKAR